jgi:hypothetical protein
MIDWKSIGVKPTVITLKSRVDRQDHAIKSAAKMGLDIDFFLAERHPGGGAHGCFDSHIKVCQAAIMKQQKRVFILEDDFEATDELMNGSASLEEGIAFINSSDDWDILYLGVLPNIWSESSERIGKYMYKCKPWSCTHAMIINEGYMKKMSEWTFGETGKDAIDWRHRTCERAYSFHPQAIKQCESPSDIRATQIPAPNFIRDMPVNSASWYARNVGYSIGKLLAISCVSVLTFAMGRASVNQNKEFAIQKLKEGILNFTKK